MLIVILAALLAFCSSLHASAVQEGFYYSYQGFALSWPGSFCSSKRCNPSWMNRWDGRSFIVHGLWPSSLHPDFIPMISSSPEDLGCTSQYKFNLGLLPRQAIGRLNQIMPDLTRNNLWAHEWNKHGVCYLKTIADYTNGRGRPVHPTFAAQVFVKYFQAISDLYDRITSRFHLRSEFYRNGDELAKDLGLNPQSVKFRVRNGQLQELTICLTFPTSLFMLEQLKPCQFPTRYYGPIRLPGFNQGGRFPPNYYPWSSFR